MTKLSEGDIKIYEDIKYDILKEGTVMTEKKEKYYAGSVGIDSDNELFLILSNGVSFYITLEQFLQLKKLFEESRK